MLFRSLFDNVGNMVSSKKIADSLTSFGRKTTSATVENYIHALEEAFILYRAGRYDVKGKQYLKSLEKYYLVDQGLRNLVSGRRGRDVGYVLENMVYLELRRRGYQVFVGKVGNLEIDFVAERGGDRAYYQVSASILDSQTYQRELAPLKAVKDHYPKYIVTMDEIPMSEDGIKQINAMAFLLGEI